MANCYGVQGYDGGGNQARWIFCGTNPKAVENPNYKNIGRDGLYWIVNGDNTPIFDQWWALATVSSITPLANQAAIDAWAAGNGYGGNCSACLSAPPPPADKYDCINAACIKNTVYNTPGFYASLAECQTHCGPGCGGQCISNTDWATIESLAVQLKNQDCS
ncbi:hypothetical protein [Nostoc sp. FACHB-110]|uniref:hypothetical protein n=1 Tax=Nostoc sp. FACHB-110 TaxID=2692834 RepID=UPI0016852ECD|nr:hypothetical protein [Nostoc sp. FACHB-110]MBD2435828.1 hypothetical protein [Nostoc sp. FACHB-110]